MTEKVCGTCKWARPHHIWWRQEGMTDEAAEEKGYMYNRDYRKITFPLVCELAEFVDSNEGDQRRLCITMDGSDYTGSLYVKPNFGCVQWEAKATEDAP